MNLSVILKSAAGWCALLTIAVFLLLPVGGPSFVSVLRFVLEGLNSFGAA